MLQHWYPKQVFIIKPRAFFYLLVATITGLLLTMPTRAAEVSTPRLIRVPIFFITDRDLLPASPKAPDSINFGPNRKYLINCKHDLFMGTAYCVVENVDHKPIRDELKQLGWSEAGKKEKPGELRSALFKGDSPDTTQAQFDQELHNKTLLTSDKNIFVFIPGFKESFEVAAGKAVNLAYYAERPLILYSWPSASKLSAYITDEGNSEWSQLHFDNFIEHLKKFCTQDPSCSIRIFAYSMGNKLLLWATPFIKEQPCFSEFGIICPDLDKGVCQHYASVYLSNKGTAKIRVYMSQKDKALTLSQRMHGGYKRLGEEAAMFASQIMVWNKVTNDKAEDTTTAQESDPLSKLEQNLSSRLQTIDFTVIDKGFMGHTVPSKLICSMSFTNQPPKGFKLVQETTTPGNKLSRWFFRKLNKLEGADNSKSSSLGTCWRVEKISTGHN